MRLHDKDILFRRFVVQRDKYVNPVRRRRVRRVFPVRETGGLGGDRRSAVRSLGSERQGARERDSVEQVRPRERD